MGLFKKIAEATGESFESVCQMQEAERNGLVEALMLEQEEVREDSAGSESATKRRRLSFGGKEDAGFPPEEKNSPQSGESSQSIVESSQEGNNKFDL